MEYVWKIIALTDSNLINVSKYTPISWSFDIKLLEELSIAKNV